MEESVVQSEPGGSRGQSLPRGTEIPGPGVALGGLLHPQSPRPNEGGSLPRITRLRDPQE